MEAACNVPADRQAIVVCTGSKHEYSTKSKPYVPAPCLLAVAAGCCYDGCCFGSRPVSYPSPRSGPPNFGGGTPAQPVPSQFPYTHARSSARTHTQSAAHSKKAPSQLPPYKFPSLLSHTNLPPKSSLIQTAPTLNLTT